MKRTNSWEMVEKRPELIMRFRGGGFKKAQQRRCIAENLKGRGWLPLKHGMGVKTRGYPAAPGS